MFTLFRVFLPLLVAGGFVFACAGSAWADDVYNFYFQKWPQPGLNAPSAPPGPSIPQVPSAQNQPVIPVVPPAPSSAAPTSAANSNAMSTAEISPAIPSNQFRHWSLGLGLNRFEDLSGGTYPSNNQETQGYALEMDYAFSKYVALGAELYTSSPTVNAIWGGAGQQIDPLHELDGSLAMIVTPFHIQIFGSNFLNLGLQVGGISPLINNWDVWNWWEFFYGAIASVDITDRIAFSIEAKHFNDMSFYSQDWSSDRFSPGAMNAYQYGVMLKFKL